MSIPYRHAEKVHLNQQAKPPGERDLAHCDALLLILPAPGAGISWHTLPHGEFLAKRARRRPCVAIHTRLCSSIVRRRLWCRG